MDFDILPHSLSVKKCKGELPKKIKDSMKGVNMLFAKYQKDPSEKNKGMVVKASTKLSETIDQYVIDQALAAKAEADAQLKAKADKEKADADASTKAKADKEKADADAAAKSKADKEKADADAAAKAKADKEKADADAAAKEKAEKEKAIADAAAKKKEEDGEYGNPYLKGMLGR